MTNTLTIVVIHGIGNQRIGATIAKWAGAIEKLNRLQGLRTNIINTCLTEAPAHATVRVNSENDDPGVDYRIVEARWADAFPQPTPRRLLRWLLLVAPGVALFQSAALLRHASSPPEKVSAVYRSATMLLPIVAGIAMLIVAAPVVLLVVALALFASMIPLPSVRKAVGSLFGSLAGTIGDAFLFVADPVSRAAMVTEVDDCIRTACGGEGEPVVVLAHSQGAAVMHRALFGPDAQPIPARLRGVITLGSGIGRLGDDFTRHLKPWTFAANIVALVAWVVVGADRFTSVPVPGRWTWLLALVVAVSASTLTIAHWWQSSAETKPPEGAPAVAWLDVWAPTDLVPAGRLFPLLTKDYEALNVPGDLSLLRDHTHYSTDLDETMPAILDYLDIVAARTATTTDRARHSLRNTPAPEHPRTYAPRDVIALFIRTLPLATSIGLLLAAGEEDRRSFGHWLSVALPDAVTNALDTVISPIRSLLSALQGIWQEPPHADSIIASTAFLAIGIATACILRWAVSIMESLDTRRWLGSGYKKVWSQSVWLLALLPLAIASLAIVSGLARVGVQPHWTPPQTVEAYLAGVAASDPTRICDVLNDHALKNLQDATGSTETSCKRATGAYLDALCENARMAYTSASIEIFGNGLRRGTTMSWTPEQPPRCTASPDLQLLLPAEITQTAHGWIISRLGTADTNGDR